MSRQWVVNASPLIILGKLSQIDLLIKLTDTLVIPNAVAQEIKQGQNNDPAKLWLTQDGREFIRAEIDRTEDPLPTVAHAPPPARL